MSAQKFMYKKLIKSFNKKILFVFPTTFHSDKSLTEELLSKSIIKIIKSLLSKFLSLIFIMFWYIDHSFVHSRNLRKCNLVICKNQATLNCF